MVCTEYHPCRGAPFCLGEFEETIAATKAQLGYLITDVTHLLQVSHAHSGPCDPLRTLRAAPKAVQPKGMSQSQLTGEVRNWRAENNPHVLCAWGTSDGAVP